RGHVGYGELGGSRGSLGSAGRRGREARLFSETPPLLPRGPDHGRTRAEGYMVLGRRTSLTGYVERCWARVFVSPSTLGYRAPSALSCHRRTPRRRAHCG